MDALLRAKADIAVKRLASYFGLEPSFFMAVIEHLRIDPKDMVDPKKFGIIAQKLAGQGLDEKEKEGLFETLPGSLILLFIYIF